MDHTDHLQNLEAERGRRYVETDKGSSFREEEIGIGEWIHDYFLPKHIGMFSNMYVVL